MSLVGFSEGKCKIALEQNNGNANLLQMRDLGAKKEPYVCLTQAQNQMGRAGFEPAKAHANGFTARPL